jgi:ribosomal protein S18 acetylase RimI-like enzyme
MNQLAPNIKICSPADFENLAKLYQKLNLAVTNAAVFNWNHQKALDELNVSESILLLDPLSLNIQSFVTYRIYPDRFEISAIGTDPELGQRGLAGKVLEVLQSKATQRDLPIWLEVHESNESALKLYRKFGFKLINTRKSYYPDGGHAFVMQFSC